MRTDDVSTRDGIALTGRGDAPVFELLGPPAALAAAASALTGRPFVPGHAVHAHGAWWCATTADRVLTIGDEHDDRAWRAAEAADLPGEVALVDRRDTFDGFRVAGPRASALLHGLGLLPPGAIGRARGAVCLGRLAGTLVGVVCEDPAHFLLFVATPDAAGARRRIAEAAGEY